MERGRNFVAPSPVRREPESIGVDAVFSGESMDVGVPLSVHEGTIETTSGMDRSLAWCVRLLPYTVIVLLLSLTLTRLSGGSLLLGFFLFAGLSLGLYAVLDYREHRHSRSGVELHKVDSLVYLKEKEMDHRHELQKLVVTSQIEMWRASGDYTRDEIGDGGREVAGRITGPSSSHTIEGTVAETGSDRRQDVTRMAGGWFRRQSARMRGDGDTGT